MVAAGGGGGVAQAGVRGQTPAAQLCLSLPRACTGPWAFSPQHSAHQVLRGSDFPALVFPEHTFAFWAFGKRSAGHRRHVLPAGLPGRAADPVQHHGHQQSLLPAQNCAGQAGLSGRPGAGHPPWPVFILPTNTKRMFKPEFGSNAVLGQGHLLCLRAGFVLIFALSHVFGVFPWH